MSEWKLYKKLGILTNDKDKWVESIPYVSSLLTHKSLKIQAKSLWLLAEMGLEYPMKVQDAVPTIVSFCDSTELLLRERAVNALGRIGRGNYRVIEPYWTDLFCLASDEEAKVRLSFIWASENVDLSLFVRTYVEQLKHIAETDDNCVVRIHCAGAIKAKMSQLAD